MSEAPSTQLYCVTLFVSLSAAVLLVIADPPDVRKGWKADLRGAGPAPRHVQGSIVLAAETKAFLAAARGRRQVEISVRPATVRKGATDHRSSDQQATLWAHL